LFDEKVISKEIEKTFKDFVAVKSNTGTELEKDAEKYLLDWLKEVEYFKNNPENFGAYLLEEDPLKRSVVWGLLKGKGKKTVILINHHDVVDSFDYGTLQEYAYDPDALAEKMKSVDITEEVKQDLESGKWYFGRGTSDMKAGAAIQLVLLKEYSKMEDFNGNLLVLSVPDEEFLSHGMRGSTGLLQELKDKFDLEYTICIDSEPHQREDENIGVLYEGSVGKIMPVIYVRGKKTHLGDIFQGLNPVALLSEIVARTDANPYFSDVVGDEVSPPPSWSFCRDNKECYDASIPESAGGYFSILTLTRTPKDILEQMEKVCNDAFDTVIERMNKNYAEFRKKGNKSEERLPWVANVKTFSAVYEEAVKTSGDKFIKDFDATVDKLKEEIVEGKINIPESTFVLIEKTLEYTHDKKPIVIIAFSPPFYPHVSNIDFKGLPETILNLSEEINRFTNENWNERYVKVNYFMGISDLSYVALNDSDEVIPYVGPNMPHWERMYSVPFEKMKELSIPIINIGPWGKDLHKFTERVYKTDLLERTPKILKHTIDYLLK
jgi:arginine utilization protein RocB